MGCLHFFLSAAALVVLVLAAIDGAQANTMVSGTVYCDQCKDGERSLFDYPVNGIKVQVACSDSNGQVTMSREQTTNWFGNYAVRFDGTPDLRGCYAKVSSSGEGSCGIPAGPAQSLKLVFSMFDMEMYAVDSLLTQPAQPMSYCPKSPNPVPSPVITPAPPRQVAPDPPRQVAPAPPRQVTPAPPRQVTPSSPPPYRLPPIAPLPPMPHLPPLPPMPHLPQLPPMPHLPPLPPLPRLPPMPPVPFLEATACPHQSWTRPEYRCYWRAVRPDTKVAVVFGLPAAERYGTDLTLWQGLQGRGDPYRTLLRESITAFLNSYNSLQYTYNTFAVVQQMNSGLMGSQRNVLYTALRFIRANSGHGRATCKFTAFLLKPEKEMIISSSSAMVKPSVPHISSLLLLILLFTLSSLPCTSAASKLSLEEATIDDMQLAFKHNQLTSRQLVQYYLAQIRKLNPVLKGILEVNPDALSLADKADYERKTKAPVSLLSKLHGIPILVKDNIATKDKMNTTAGSLALLGSVVPRDAGVVQKLRKAGAIILGKASLSEWSHFRSNAAPSGWNARGGYGLNPYTFSDPCGSSSGSAISVAANMVSVSLGTETDGSILCPSGYNSVVGIKPTIGLTSRAGVVPISQRQDTVGPICRTVADAAYVLDAIAGIDHNDIATIETSKYIPRGGYAQFLRRDGLRGKRIGILRTFYEFGNDTSLAQTFEKHLNTMRKGGAVLVDNLKVANFSEIYFSNDEDIALSVECKISLNAYLKELVASPVRSLADVIAFNNKHRKQEKIKEYGQDLLIAAEATNGFGKTEKQTLLNFARWTRNGLVRLVTQKKLDAVVTPKSDFSKLLAIAGAPGVTVPAGFENNGRPAGICFGGLRGSEPKLIEIAYAFEQATKIRKRPTFKGLKF
ncbi:probable amidase At4g34880 [Argentina anserina]|uniref:probable amidase At4g34880 n=1 Tax=Argentina anserina TaxID=57926 RepID=UPI0021766BAE|nr:probable amidase At4g34880 [Potentilla anserina]